MEMKRKKDDVENNDSESIPHILWLVAFKKYDLYNSEPKIILRQFYSPGFYESYDMVTSFSEKSNLEILWFKEKNNFINHPYYSRMFPLLESFCTYCNKKYNENEPIPCNEIKCYGEFCSRSCLDEHHKLRHKKQEKK